MRNLILAVAFALGLGFAATGAQAAAVGSNLSGIESVARTGATSMVVKANHRRWHHRHYRHRHHGWRHNYRHRSYGWRHNHRHHRRYNHRHRHHRR